MGTEALIKERQWEPLHAKKRRGCKKSFPVFLKKNQNTHVAYIIKYIIRYSFFKERAKEFKIYYHGIRS
uniref:Uncharacterized protein n=1 Tax=Dulem virus 214 TaxID=3145691 RepID=A0AAU8AWW9_9VIRU